MKHKSTQKEPPNPSPPSLRYPIRRVKKPNRLLVLKIADRQIPLHNHYGVSLQDNKEQEGFLLSQSDRQKRGTNSTDSSLRNTILYDRPVHFLKKYLIRKEKMLFAPLYHTNPEQFQQEPPPINQFRIKKERRSKAWSVERPSSPMGYNEVNENQQQNYKYGPSKDLYQMTTQELARSIQLKRQFLDLISKRMEQNRTIYKNIQTYKSLAS